MKKIKTYVILVVSMLLLFPLSGSCADDTVTVNLNYNQNEIKYSDFRDDLSDALRSSIGEYIVNIKTANVTAGNCDIKSTLFLFNKRLVYNGKNSGSCTVSGLASYPFTNGHSRNFDYEATITFNSSGNNTNSKVIISLDPNGGTISSNDGWSESNGKYIKTIDKGSCTYLPSFSKSNDSFIGFKDSSGNLHTIIECYSPTESVNLTATYTNSGGGASEIPSVDRLPIGGAVEEEIELDPPTNYSVDGVCYDYLVKTTGKDYSVDLQIPSINNTGYKGYTATTHCLDNVGQEYAAFCLDPGNTSPSENGANYVLDEELDPSESQFASGAVYIYRWYLDNISRGNTAECISDVALRYLMYDRSLVGNIAVQTSLASWGAPYVTAYQNHALTGTCADEGLTLYNEAKNAAINGYESEISSLEVKLTKQNFSTDANGYTNGTIKVDLIKSANSNAAIQGTPVVTCPNGLNCNITGSGTSYTIAISGKVNCNDLDVSVSVEYQDDKDVRNVLMVKSDKFVNWQRFMLFLKNGNLVAEGTVSLDAPTVCSPCKTSLDFACRPEGSDASSPIILQEGTINGNVDWAQCIYNQADEKGNNFDIYNENMANETGGYNYCTISCSEEWEFYLPGNVQTVSGRYFRLNAQVGATRVCRAIGEVNNGVVSEIKYDEFKNDYETVRDEMTNYLNEYSKLKAEYDALKDYIDSGAPENNMSGPDKSGPSGCDNGSYEDHSSLDDKYLNDDNKYYTDNKFSIKNSYRVYDVYGNYTTINSVSFSISNNSVEHNEKVDGEKTEKKCTNLLGNNCVEGTLGCTCNSYTTSCVGTITYTIGDGTNPYNDKLDDIESDMNTAWDNYTAKKSELQQIVTAYKKCTDFENKYEFDPTIKFTYAEESYMDLLYQHTNKNYMINRNDLGDRSSLPSYYGDSNFVSSTGENLQTFNFADCGSDAPYACEVGTDQVKNVNYAQAVVTYGADETDFRSGVYFYTIPSSGLVTTNENTPNAVKLGYVYPISLNTKQGKYPYTLSFSNVGQYNDKDSIGRIMGTSSTSILTGDAADYSCSYTVCDPTIEDCPLQMCEIVVDSSGTTIYHGKDGSVVSESEYKQQCSKSCTYDGTNYYGVNGDVVSYDEYVEQCEKPITNDCAGYTLVTGSNVSTTIDNDGRLQFLPKIISLNNLFSSGNQTPIALNWQNSKAEAARNEIEQKGESIFSEASYSYTFTPNALAEIRNYNDDQEQIGKGFADFNATCDEYGRDCTSNFLDDIDDISGVTVNKRDNTFTHDSSGYSYK